MKILFYLNLLSVFCCFGQEKAGEKIFSELTNYYSNSKNYAIDFSYALYKEDEEKELLTEKYNVSFYKNDLTTRFDVLGCKMYTFNTGNKYLISVFDKEKEIVVRSDTGNDNVDGLSQLSNFKDNYNIILESENKKEQILKLVPKPEKITLTNYSLITIVVDKIKNRILEQKLVFKEKMAFPSTSGEIKKKKAILKVIFLDKLLDKHFKLPKASYFIKEVKGGVIQPSTNFEGYKIIDKRIKSANR